MTDDIKSNLTISQVKARLDGVATFGPIYTHNEESIIIHQLSPGEYCSNPLHPFRRLAYVLFCGIGDQ